MTAPHCPGVGRYFPLGPKDILAFCNGAIRVNAAENCSATTDLPVVYDDKPAKVRNPVVVIDNEWSTGLDCESADLISLQLFASVALRLQGGRIHDSLD